ncbi:uncharacterized protein LOC112514965 isoform X1 [Cynara cardunculus var. scolymus]|uniref:uncharacterized protein LOC112514965 isoform X1 n=1 Tax=Cynara cardunculus var. scolymus TaxID=59895 RepID=UPI000D63133A|nr:uncharacterized protein LOC112514965 isoform X1 [Cynara cardunculus var. scolymus]
MAKNRNKSKKKASTSMNIDEAAIVAPQVTAMDTSEVVASSRSQISRKPKGVQMKRTKNVRRLKAIAKAVSQNEKSAAKVVKNESKTLRTQSAKKLYD